MRQGRKLLRSVLGDALRQARQDQGRTLADVAKAARISMPYLSEVERGRKEVSSEVLAALCQALGLDLADVLVAVVIDLTRSSLPVPSSRASATPSAASSPASAAMPHSASALSEAALVPIDLELTPATLLRVPSLNRLAPPVRRPGDAYALAA